MLARPMELLLIKTKLVTDADAARMLSRGVAWSAYGLGAMSLLGTVGVDTSPLLAGVGITGITVGFAVKEVATNFLSGAMLVMGRHVRKGQRIRLLCAPYPNVEGVVESLDWRNVVLRQTPSSLSSFTQHSSSTALSTSSSRSSSSPPHIISQIREHRIVVPSVIVFTNPFIIIQPSTDDENGSKQ
jgi:hypothetical protein